MLSLPDHHIGQHIDRPGPKEQQPESCTNGQKLGELPTQLVLSLADESESGILSNTRYAGQTDTLSPGLEHFHGDRHWAGQAQTINELQKDDSGILASQSIPDHPMLRL